MLPGNSAGHSFLGFRELDPHSGHPNLHVRILMSCWHHFAGILVSFAVPLFRYGCFFSFCSLFRDSKFKIKILHMIMASLVSNLTVAEAHNELGSLIDCIAAKNEELLSGKYGEA